ncbi:MAG: hypothetical protein JNN30_00895 [Rhodanobacteraceae bacterium]|nr:hypothetical protein [Rhodanobacteraceae bacterium]
MYSVSSVRPLGYRLAATALALFGLNTSAPAQSITYEFDPAFNGNYSIDAFTSGENNGAERYGVKVVRLPGGDVVTAGLVRLDNDPIAPHWNVGLVRTSPGGVRQVWSGSGPYFHAGNQYVVYPNLVNGGSGIATIRKIADFAYANGRLYVLVRSRFSADPPDHDVQLLVFAEDGSFVNAINVLNSSADENAVALDLRETGLIATPVVIAALGTVSGFRGAIAKYRVDASGLIQLDSSFGGGDGRIEFVLPTAECDHSDCALGVSDIAFPQGAGVGSNFPLYVAGSVQRTSSTSTDFDMAVLEFAADGQLDPAFDENGVRQYAFDLPNSSLADFARALVVRRSIVGGTDTVWMAGAVAGRCTQMAGVVRLAGSTGAPVNTFGPGSRVVFGTPQPSPGEPCGDPANLEPTGLITTGEEIVVGATAFLTGNAAASFTSGALATLSAETGALLSLDGLQLSDGGNLSTRSRIDGIAAGEGGRRVYVAGSGAVGPYNSLFLTARVKPRDDTIFRNGFQ